MILLRPITVDATILTSSSVLETAPSAYVGSTSYSLGDQVSVLTGTVAALYESLQNFNVGNTPAASPAFWEPIGTTYSIWSSGATYAALERVISTTTHRVYESIAGGNINNAVGDTTKWLDIGPTNKWAMFDSLNGTVTTHPNEIDVTLSMSGRIDGVALINMSNVVSVQVIVSTVADGELYNETFATVSTVGVDDWYDFFFEEVVQKDGLMITGLPVHSDPTIQIILTGSGTTDMSVGTVMPGRTKYLGATLRDGASIGIDDFSRKDRDAFGNYLVVERAYAKRGAFRLSMPHTMVDDVDRTLAQYRATPVVISGAAEFSSTLFFGFVRNFSLGFQYPTTSHCSLEIEGLT